MEEVKRWDEVNGRPCSLAADPSMVLPLIHAQSRLGTPSGVGPRCTHPSAPQASTVHPENAAGHDYASIASSQHAPPSTL